MIAKLELYKNCTDEKPFKTYVCRRLIAYVSKKVNSLFTEMQNETDEARAEQLLLEALQTIFPDFTEEEAQYLDPESFTKFVGELNTFNNNVVNKAIKN